MSLPLQHQRLPRMKRRRQPKANQVQEDDRVGSEKASDTEVASVAEDWEVEEAATPGESCRSDNANAQVEEATA